MRNVSPYCVKTSIVKSADEFLDDIRAATGEPDANICIEYDGITIDCETDNIEECLAKFYDVKEVTSLHIDDCDFAGVWITFKD